MYSSGISHESIYNSLDRDFELSQRSEYSKVTPYERYSLNPSSSTTPYFNAAYNQQKIVPNLQYQEHGIRYQHETQDKNEELKLQHAILRDIMAYKNSGQLNGAWALITYMEYHRRVRDIYVTEKYYVIDNTNYVQDQFKTGLRSLQQCKAEILFHGNLHILLSQNKYGSISLINKSNFPVFIKDHLDMEQPYFSQEVIEQQGVIFNQKGPIEIFDIEEFRSEMALQIYHNQFDREQLKLFCKTNVLFDDADHCMKSSSWIMVTNLLALDFIFDQQEYSVLEEQIANFVAASNLSKIRKKRKKTFKERTNTLQKEFETKRKTRLSLAMKGLKIKEFMKYSWENEDVVSPEDAVNINNMGEFFEPERDYMYDFEIENTRSNHAKLVGEKMWAKVKYTLENMNNENI